MKPNITDHIKKLMETLPDIRWNITERDEHGEYIYFGDEWDNWCHLDEKERAEYFGKIFDVLTQLKRCIKIEK